MLELKKIAVTGGLSCGKSSVCRILNDLGAYVVSADAIVHQLLVSNEKLVQEIVNLLGPQVLSDGKIDRLKVAKVVFGDQRLLQMLEELIHPLVYEEINKDYQTQSHLPCPPSLFIAEIPLLYESGHENDYDVVIVVTSEETDSLKRFEQATGQTQSEFKKRIQMQIPLKQKELQADYVIRNIGSFDELIDNTKKLYHKLTCD